MNGLELREFLRVAQGHEALRLRLGGKGAPPPVFCKDVIRWGLVGGGLQKM
jgi:hypothetical protein